MEENEQFVIFDEYPRYKIVEQVAEFIRGDDRERKLRVLEIGANAHKHLRLFLPWDEILFTDIELSQEMESDPEFQQADGTALPFEDGSFDLAVATDVLEHVPEEKRAALLGEAYRVAKCGAVVTFPQNSEDVRAAEARVNQFYKAVSGEDYVWLKEHAACGLPDTDEIDRVLDSMGCTYLHLDHGDIRTWERMYYSLFSAAAGGTEWEFNRHINAYFNREMYAGDVSDSCYRAIYVLWHGETASLEKYLDRQPKPQADRASFLQELLAAQEKIPVLSKLLDLQRRCAAQETREAYLESRNEAIEKQWKADAAQWEQYSKQWKQDVAQWQKDNEQWKADAASWREQRRGYEGRIAYLESQNEAMEQQWKADAAQWEQYSEQWKQDVAQWQKDNEQWKADAASWQEQRKGYEGHIAYLESQNEAMEQQWKADAAQWEQYGEQWKRDVTQWQKDNEQWKADAASWQEQRKGYEGRIAYLEFQNEAMEQQWKADATQWEQCGEQWQKDVAQWQSDQAQWQAEKDRLAGELSEREAAYEQVVHSLSWRLTKPLRSIDAVVGRLFRKK